MERFETPDADTRAVAPIGNGTADPRRLGFVRGVDDVLFVYGTLQFPAVLIELLGHCPSLEPVEVSGWRVAALPGRLYPGLVSRPASVAGGVLLTGLADAEWKVLDAFEDAEYDLSPLVVPGHARVLTYVWTAEVSPEDWDADRFALDHLAEFTARCVRWRAGLSTF
ncbi:gamma-glutamylcyclotransferase family protein [Nocardia sp. NBC_01009]|uniref:gamma-glutamylcyclotransferase family protein n=1 Tax=Nocardia sp. NBC_01009 TaxID=2975996 RepID=UPI00386EFAF7|nr:gamma-glutamylcyclotransferase [Nocardia sp. NBC_01009]